MTAIAFCGLSVVITMARIILTWELGGGLGHLMNLRPLAMGLAARGHHVFLAAGDLSRVAGVFVPSSGQWSVGSGQLAPGSARGRVENAAITMLAAPWKTARTKTVETIITYADLLLNIGFGDGEALAVRLQAWRNLFDLVQPDLLVCDHSPTALLAAKGQPFPVATVGTGFFTPVDEAPLRLLRRVPPAELPAVRAREARLVEIMNEQLERRKADAPTSSFIAQRSSLGPIERVTQLYHDGATKHFLLTFPELDHFGARDDGDYRGALPYGLAGEPFRRPSANSPCVFVYFKPFPALAEFLRLLANSSIGAVIYIDGWRDEQLAPFRSKNLHFARRPVDIRQAADECDCALTNGNSATSSAILLAGKPLVSVPPFLEQWLFAAAVERIGAGITANVYDAGGILDAVRTVLAEPRFARAVGEFAQRHRGHCGEAIAGKIVDEMETLV